ncbi:MAG TPA: DUF3307 domain-containing protein [Halomonas sp.]|nr:DUF3307 domain-containing protein [Halomonas sp.]
MTSNELSLLLGLVLAHLVGDFLLQPRHWVEERIRLRHRSRHLYYHSAVHGGLTALVLLDQLAAVGFLLAAKSVLRYGDLREAGDRKLTEYVLLGTLVSVATTLVLGLTLRLLLSSPM